MEPAWALSTASSLHQLACQRRPPGSGAQGRAPHPDSNAKLQAHGPRSSRQLGGAQAQISVVERWWGPQIPGPIHFTDVQQLDYPLYHHVPSQQLHPSYPPEVPQYVPTFPAKGRKKKGDLFLMVVWKGGEGGQPSFTKENCPDPKKISCAPPATRTDLDLHRPSLPSSSTPLSPTPASHRNQRLRAVPTTSPLPLHETLSVSLSSLHNG